MADFSKVHSNNHAKMCWYEIKGQLISKWNFGVLNFPKNYEFYIIYKSPPLLREKSDKQISVLRSSARPHSDGEFKNTK